MGGQLGCPPEIEGELFFLKKNHCFKSFRVNERGATGWPPVIKWGCPPEIEGELFFEEKINCFKSFGVNERGQLVAPWENDKKYKKDK